MRNFELPLYLVANKAGDDVSLTAIAEAHRIYDGLEEHEYREKAPDLQVITAQRLFAELNGPTWQERQEHADAHHQIEQVPKCLDIPLAFASGGDIERARWLLEDMIEQGILHEPSSQHTEFFEQADMMEEGFEQISKAEAKRRQKEVMRSLRRNQ